MSDPAAGPSGATGTRRADDAATMLLGLAADLPHPPRARLMGDAARADSLLFLSDWAARTAGGVPPDEQHRPPHRPRLLGLCGSSGRRTLASVIAAAGLDIGERALAPDPADLPGAVAEAQHAVDQEVDGGADLLLVVGDELDRDPALGLTSLLCLIEPAALMPYDTARDDAQWMRELVLIRDARRAAGMTSASIAHSVCAAGGAALAAATAVLLQAARRRTPVIIDGLTPAVAAMAASSLAPGAEAWWRLAGSLWPPAEKAVTAALGLDPVCPIGAQAPTGSAGAIVLAMVRIAVAAAR